MTLADLEYKSDQFVEARDERVLVGKINQFFAVDQQPGHEPAT